MKRTISVMDAMTRMPVVVGPEVRLMECARKMIAENVGSLIVKENDILRGMLTEKDLVRAMTEGLDPKSVKVSEVMSKDVITVRPEKDVLEAIRLMSEKKVRRLPVIDRDENLVGLLTVGDILKVEPMLLEIAFEKNLLTGSFEKNEEEGECELCGNFGVVHESGRKNVCDECD